MGARAQNDTDTAGIKDKRSRGWVETSERAGGGIPSSDHVLCPLLHPPKSGLPPVLPHPHPYPHLCLHVQVHPSILHGPTPVGRPRNAQERVLIHLWAKCAGKGIDSPVCGGDNLGVFVAVGYPPYPPYPPYPARSSPPPGERHTLITQAEGRYMPPCASLRGSFTHFYTARTPVPAQGPIPALRCTSIGCTLTHKGKCA